MAGNRAIQEIVFHRNVVVPTDGSVYQITTDSSTINLGFDGSGTFMAIVEGKVSIESLNFNEIMAVNLKTLDMNTHPIHLILGR